MSDQTLQAIIVPSMDDQGRYWGATAIIERHGLQSTPTLTIPYYEGHKAITMDSIRSYARTIGARVYPAPQNTRQANQAETQSTAFGPTPIHVRRTAHHGIIPTRATSGSAGMDLALPCGYRFCQGAITRVGLQVAVAIPDGHVGLVLPRSSLGRMGLTLANTVGVIDSDYRGELMLDLYLRQDENAPQERILRRRQHIAQLLVMPVSQASAIEVDELDDTERGGGGFGSTGI